MMKKELALLLAALASAGAFAAENALVSEEITLSGAGAWKLWPADAPVKLERQELPEAKNGAMAVSLAEGRATLYTMTALAPDSDYVLHLRIRRERGPIRNSRPQIQLSFRKADDPKNGSAGSLTRTLPETSEDVFQDLSVEFHTPAEATGGQLALVFDHMAGLCFIDSVRLEKKAPAAPARSLHDGISFEDDSDLGGQWFSNDPANVTVKVSDEFAVTGKKSVKIVFANHADGLAHFIPREADWSKYAALKLTIHNPDSGLDYAQYRIIFRSRTTGNAAFEGAPMVDFRIPRESSVTYYVELGKVNSKMDFKTVSQVLFYRNPQYPDSTTYIDDVQLLTADELENERNGKKRAQAAKLYTSLQNELKNANASYRPAMEQLLPEVKRVAELKSFAKEDDEALLAVQDAAGRLVTASALLKKYPAKNDLSLFAAPSTAKVFRDEEIKADDRDWAPELLSVRREYQAFQVVAVPAKEIQGVTVSVTAPALEGNPAVTIPADGITVNPVGYLEIYSSADYPSSRDGWWPDPLVNNQELTLKNQLQPYWITLFVPPAQPVGTYRGKVSFSADGKLLNEMEFAVKVAAPVLPVRNQLLTYFHYSDPVAVDPAKQKEMRRAGYEFFLKHRLNPISMYLNTSGEPVSVPDLDDLDFCLERGLNLIDLWYLYDLGNKRFPDRPEAKEPANVQPGFFRDEYLAEIVEFVKKVKPVYEKHGCADMLMLHGFDEIMHKPASVYKPQLAEAERVCAYFRKELPDMKLSNIGRRMAIKPELMDYWWVLPIDKSTFKDLQDAGKTVCFYWVYEDPSFMLDQPGIAARLTAWLTFQQGAAGMGYYSTYRPWATKCKPETAPTGVDWSKKDFDCITGRRLQRIMDGDLLYPNRDGSYMTSIRFENLRDGIQDYELLAMLKKADPGNPLLAIPESIVTLRQGVYTHDYKVLADYRAKVIAELEKFAK